MITLLDLSEIPFGLDSTLENEFNKWKALKVAEPEFCLGCTLNEYQILLDISSLLEDKVKTFLESRGIDILEIGPGNGCSAWALMLGGDYIPNLLQVDIDTKGQRVLPPDFRRRISSFTGTSREFFKDNPQTFDLIFIDGDHTNEEASADIRDSLKVLRPGGVILLHDVSVRACGHIAISAKKAAEETHKAYHDFQTDGNGLAIIY